MQCRLICITLVYNNFDYFPRFHFNLIQSSIHLFNSQMAVYGRSKGWSDRSWNRAQVVLSVKAISGSHYKRTDIPDSASGMKH